MQNATARLALCLLTLPLWLGTHAAAQEAGTPSPKPSRYTFTWPLGPGAPAPRGGTTRGPELQTDREPSRGWQALQAPGLSAYERDRRAILAMAGSYRVAFDFLEVLSFAPDSGGAREQPYQRPYQSWGTEKIFVDRDEERFISLVHILEMRVLDENGKLSEPMVTKHWRQDWRYEPRQLAEHAGDNGWRVREIARDAAAGQWSQTVAQVDESPRYSSLGRWQHTASFSSWISGETWRPLPRREWSVRKDYQVLVGTNRHTVTPWGWVQEENNLKGVLAAGGELKREQPYVGREYGVARYERLRDADFAAADQYYSRTREFWTIVHDEWQRLFAKRGEVRLNAAVDQAGLFEPLFEQADEIASGKTPQRDSRAVIQDAFRAMGASRD